MNKKQKQKLQSLKSVIRECQKLLVSAERMLLEINGEETEPKKQDLSLGSQEIEAPHFLALNHLEDEDVIEGIFNGREMKGQNGEIYPVPENYASKSRILEGDRLKLTITREGRFIFKQIGPLPRESLKGFLHYAPEEDQYSVLAEGKSYKVLSAPVTYFNGEVGDEAAITVPLGRGSSWAAIEAILKDGAESVKTPVALKPKLEEI
ncbi:MAG: 50S ribosomal protein L7/L12 [Parcubacteria group bacterium GW2011_GWF2_44_17]|nr:MAG: 50S ribosomal protein L7/L12 [Parcubacteria group bacterium GW2011_GWF2_44_17]